MVTKPVTIDHIPGAKGLILKSFNLFSGEHAFPRIFFK